MIVDKKRSNSVSETYSFEDYHSEQNQTADAWKFGYRTVGIAEAKDNKKVAIYVHKAGE